VSLAARFVRLAILLVQGGASMRPQSPATESLAKRNAQRTKSVRTFSRLPRLKMRAVDERRVITGVQTPGQEHFAAARRFFEKLAGAGAQVRSSALPQCFRCCAINNKRFATRAATLSKPITQIKIAAPK